MKRTADGKEILEDGETLRRPMFMMDGVQRAVSASAVDASLHRPGHAMLTDEQSQARQKLYADHDKKLADAWKSSALTADAKPTPNGQSLQSLYEARDAKLRDAWRGAA